MKQIVIDTVDFTELFTPSGYSVWYEAIEGGQSAVMLDGTTSVDEITIKAVVSLPCWPLSDEQLQSLFSVLLAQPVHTVKYYDPHYGTRTATMKRRLPRQKYKGLNVNGVHYWTGTTVELVEK